MSINRSLNLTSTTTNIGTLPTGYVPLAMGEVAVVTGARNFLGTMRTVYENGAYNIQIVVANSSIPYSGYVIGTLIVVIK